MTDHTEDIAGTRQSSEKGDTDMNQAPILRLDSLGKSYGSGPQQARILAGVDFDVHAGEFVCVVGPSGSGKSTLIKTVNALEPYQKGEIIVNDISLSDPKTDLPKLRSKVGMVFQHFELFPHLSVTENLTIAQIKVLGRSVDDAKARGLKMLDRVGLMAHKDKFPGQLSGGEQQRVALARAFAPNPRVLLADEPTGELDFHTGVQILELLQDQAKAGKTVLVVTHNREISRVADRVVELSSGRIVSDGPPAGGVAAVADLRW